MLIRSEALAAASGLRGYKMGNLTDRVRHASEVTLALLASAVALWLGLGKGRNFVENVLLEWGIPRPFAVVVGWGLPIGVIAFLWVLAWRSTMSRSRILNPDRFELTAKRRDQIKGRDQDIRDLLELVAAYPLIFLVGESGSGKSAVMEAGVVSELKEGGQIVPILVRRYGSGWETGPLKEAMLALWEALPESARDALGMTVRPVPSAITLEVFAKTLAKIGTKLGRQPLLIFDQFDDYQLAHRSQFTTDGGAWRDAAALEKVNGFWQVVGKAVRSDTAPLSRRHSQRCSSRAG